MTIAIETRSLRYKAFFAAATYAYTPRSSQVVRFGLGLFAQSSSEV